MGLHDYRHKRDFKKTAEPRGKISPDKDHLFIIQKHAASHLHYDFRLELNGVLLSWALPKGPCLDPSVKRLAMQVEDHPVDYGSFEGIIPKGQYGGGTVLLWDKGVWYPLDENPTKAYKEGHLRFELDAHKLQGRWDLFRFKEDKHWFLVKKDDEYAKPLSRYNVIEKEPLSVVTEQSIEEIKENYEHVWTKEGEKKARKQIFRQTQGSPQVLLPEDLAKAPFPSKLSPQLATLTDKAPKGDEWLHEIKWDGYRMISFIKGGEISLKSRNHLDWTAELMSLATMLKKLKFKNVVFDGEVVLLDEEGKSNFQLLQNAIMGKHSGDFIYYIFDILYYDQFDLRHLPLSKRKDILRSLLPEKHPNLIYNDHIIANGQKVFYHSCDLGLEGIISKKMDSVYEAGRSKTWLKVKCLKQQAFVIGAYSDPRGAREHFGSLLLGIYNDEGELDYVGNVGTGFTKSSLKEIYHELQHHKSRQNPFNTIPPRAGNAHWLKPVLVAEIEFTQWTESNHIRHPSFKGLRLDKKAKDIKREKITSLKDVKKEIIREKKVENNSKKASKSSHFNITHPEKILYPEDSFTKQDLLEYYESVSDYILPFIKNRPLSLVRCPKHYSGCFFQRHYNKMTPKALKSIDIESKGECEPYVYLDDKEGLLSLVQMDVLEIHPWGSTIFKLETPDIIIFDLDPAPNVSWKAIVAGALDIKRELEQLHLQSFIKTTGGKGLHVFVPIEPVYVWDDVKQFTHVFVDYLEQKHPNKYISKMTKAKRVGKIFIDYLRNQRSATAVSAYSTRSRLHAPVSVPIDWSELSTRRTDTAFTIKTLPQRLMSLKQDPWHDFWNIKQSLPLSDLK